MGRWYEKTNEVWAVTTAEPIQQRHFRVPELFSLVCQIPTDYDYTGMPYEHTHYLNIITAPSRKRLAGSRDNAIDYDIADVLDGLNVLCYSHVSQINRVHTTES